MPEQLTECNVWDRELIMETLLSGFQSRTSVPNYQFRILHSELYPSSNPKPIDELATEPGGD